MNDRRRHGAPARLATPAVNAHETTNAPGGA
jgi:hypothetical protein